MNLSTYLYDGRGEEAAAFYKQAIGAESVCMMRYSASPDPHAPKFGMLTDRFGMGWMVLVGDAA